jgi:hypothetical protein
MPEKCNLCEHEATRNLSGGWSQTYCSKVGRMGESMETSYNKCEGKYYKKREKPINCYMHVGWEPDKKTQFFHAVAKKLNGKELHFTDNFTKIDGAANAMARWCDQNGYVPVWKQGGT